MSAARRYLFICGKNKHRSPTAEQIFAGHPGLDVMSAGLAADSDLPLDDELIDWAGRVFVMEARQRRAVERRFPAASRKAPVVVLGIADDYRFMESSLVELLRARMAPYLP